MLEFQNRMSGCGLLRPSPTHASSSGWASLRRSIATSSGHEGAGYDVEREEETPRGPSKTQTNRGRKARRERKKKFMTIFIKGKQKRVPRPPVIDDLPVEEFIARNADPIWLHNNGLWELMTSDGES